MTTEDRIKAFSLLGKRLQYEKGNLQIVAEGAARTNPWFTKENVERAFDGIIKLLEETNLRKWVSAYTLTERKEKIVAVVMAGNIPLVGFHDFLTILMSGNSILIKLSSKDSVLLPFVSNLLIEIEPRFESKIQYTERLKNFDAVIATGSDNSARYFEYYFGKYPHIIRQNRTSCAILTGDESDQELQNLGTDVFSYFGLGCRNVSKLFIPEHYNFDKLFLSWEKFRTIINHHKYCNNYDYQKSILLVNGTPHLDNGFVLLTESDKTVSPISTVYYETYHDAEGLKERITTLEGKLQCIVAHNSTAIPFGQAQYPDVWDYADQIDTRKFLSGL